MAARGRGRPARLPAIPCPVPLHAGSKVIAKGTRRTAAGIQRRYHCRPVGRDPHTFAILATRVDLVAGRQARLASLAATVLDANGNVVPKPRHHPATPKRTRPLRFARTA